MMPRSLGGAVRLVALSLCLATPPVVGQEVEAEVLLEATPAEASVRRPVFAPDPFVEPREAMVQDHIAGRRLDDPAVLAAMRRVPRHRFAPEVPPRRAYRDEPQPIGHGQTISQPYIVAFMTARLGLEPDDRVLEVGTGSGYQAAILAEIVREVVTLEIIPALATEAAERLAALGYTNITVLQGDGYYGDPARAPFDAIIVTAAARHVPPPLVAQLRPGGRLVIPVGQMLWVQNLLLLEKDADGEVSTRNLASVRFVPLTGGH
ncbi:protein-L-isoaspartate(D-aspartate) O-methyltransferase [Halomonas maura]|uniref:protein-L-isoaspartate(D-aspartate) O-methyltransferase n=1 Tax=Halomonas maura TaxID=117606 RepID=UPI0025B2CAAF|nr:protein-L-isoaspartate(D-aspartate) O-methyltransferase [Halomonas maura]MDN3557395.1 protein-L-isoaspartate(D-aspartate) O-methyltransferase [Halomonas maura]